MRWSSGLLALAATSLLGVGAAHAANDEFRAVLRGAQEVPAVATNTSGVIEINFSGSPPTLLVELSISRGRRVTQAHFHCGRRGVNGPIVAFIAGFHDRGRDFELMLTNFGGVLLGLLADGGTVPESAVAPSPRRNSSTRRSAG